MTKIGDWAFCQYFETEQDGTLGFHNSAVDNEVRYLMGDSSLTSVTLGKYVKELGTCAFANSGITTLNIPNSLNIIGDHTFYCCENLQTISFEENSTLSYINLSAFSGCSKLNNVVLPASVERIEGTAFLNCVSMDTFSFETNSKLKYMGPKTFRNVPIKTITIPKSVETLGYQTFLYIDANGNSLSKLETVIFEENSSLKTIEYSCFDRCSLMSSINLDACSNLETIEGGAFRDCSALTSIYIPASVTKIGSGASTVFYNTNLSSVVVENLTSYLNIEFADYNYVNPLNEAKKLYVGELNETNLVTTITAEDFGNTISKIYDYMFIECTSLTSVELPKQIKSIGKKAFENCSSLKSLTFENDSVLETIGAKAFYACSQLESFVVPAKTKSLGNDAFYNCSNLASITFAKDTNGDNSLTTIGYYAFANCTSLTEFIITKNVTSIGYSLFSGVNSSSRIPAVTFEDETNTTWTLIKNSDQTDQKTITIKTTSGLEGDALATAKGDNGHSIRSNGLYNWTKNIPSAE